jgi:SSS family solute:Na+ symporter
VTIALIVFIFFFILVTVAGFLAARWRRPVLGMHSLDEWGLGGRSFGTWTSWFLMGGDTYTAYTVIAVPAALYGAGASGFFALPYAIIAYPYMMVCLPRLWSICHRHGYVTFADFVAGRYSFKPLTLAIAFTGILALMPYIALQLVGIKVVIAAFGITGEWPLILAFVILSAYTWSSGLRAPAVIAIVKDVMLYTMVLVAIIWLPIKLGGYARIFEIANQRLGTHGASVHLAQGQFLGYSTLAIGSAIALMLYPHTATAVLSAKSANTVRRNAVMVPSFSFLLGLIAILGYAALAAGITVKPTETSNIIPMLFLQQFPPAFAGFCLAAIAVGALVPAAIMSIAASNLFTRNIWGVFTSTPMTPKQESSMAKTVSLLVKFGALVFVLKLQTAYAIQMQLLGGIWITQLFPAVILGCFLRSTSRFALHPWALFVGWAAGMACGTGMAWSLSLKSSIYPIPHVGGVYAAIPALLLNLGIAALGTAILRLTPIRATEDITDPSAYIL